MGNRGVNTQVNTKVLSTFPIPLQVLMCVTLRQGENKKGLL